MVVRARSNGRRGVTHPIGGAKAVSRSVYCSSTWPAGRSCTTWNEELVIVNSQPAYYVSPAVELVNFNGH